MSHRNLTTVLSLVAVALIGSAIASPALANAAHYNVSDSHYSDAGMVSDSGKAPSCYTEPSGFHNSIHWDNACRNGQKTDRMKAESVETAKSNLAEPSGFHHNVRSR